MRHFVSLSKIMTFFSCQREHSSASKDAHFFRKTYLGNWIIDSMIPFVTIFLDPVSEFCKNCETKDILVSCSMLFAFSLVIFLFKQNYIYNIFILLFFFIYFFKLFRQSLLFIRKVDYFYNLFSIVRLHYLTTNR